MGSSNEMEQVDLIDRQAVIDLLKQMRKDGDMVPWEGKDVFARIRKLPSAQPERKTGKWIKKPEFCGDDVSGFIDNHFSCSECKKEAEINSWGFYILSDFCPHCGARLVQEGEEP